MIHYLKLPVNYAYLKMAEDHHEEEITFRFMNSSVKTGSAWRW